MTDEFKQLTGLLAKGMNFKDNAVVLGVGIKDGEDLGVTTVFNGDEVRVRLIIQCLIEQYLKSLDDTTAAFARDELLTAFKEDEERRRNK